MALVMGQSGSPGAGSFDGNGAGMIMVLGVTGAGKSYFINRLANAKVVEEGAGLASRTQKVEMVPVKIGNTPILLIDTPGFDDTKRSDADILNEIARVLAAQYALGFKLRGIVYMHRISDVRFSGSNIKTFDICERMCGEQALENVLLVTSRWHEVDDATGAAREREIRDDFWAYMLERGSCMSRFYGDHSSAVVLASQLIVKQSVVLRLQYEMIDEGKDLNETSAGLFLEASLDKRRGRCLSEIQSLEKRCSELRETDRRMRLKMEADWEVQQAALRDMEQQQAELRRNVAREVRLEIEQETKTKTKSKGLSRLMPLVPMSVALLCIIMGIPPDSMASLFSPGQQG